MDHSKKVRNEAFLNALFGRFTGRVTLSDDSVGNIVHVKFDKEASVNRAIGYMERLLRSDLRRSLPHLESIEDEQEAKQQEEDEQDQLTVRFTQLLAKSPSRVFKTIFADDALQYIFTGDEPDFDEVEMGGLVVHSTSGSNSRVLSCVHANHQLLLTVFGNPILLKRIIEGSEQAVSQERLFDLPDTQEDLSNVMSSNTDAGGVSLIINMPAIFQLLAGTHVTAEVLPIIAPDITGKGDCVVNLRHLTLFLSHHVGDIIFAEGLKPVMYPLRSVEDDFTPPKVNFLLDVSGSMAVSMGNFPTEVLPRVRSILQQVLQLDSRVLDVTTFNSTATTTRVETDNEVELAINQQPQGMTALYSTMNARLLAHEYDDSSASSFIVVTDGSNTVDDGVTEAIVTATIEEIREHNDNVQVFFIDLGNCNEEFFDKISRGSGCTRISSSNLRAMEEFENYVVELKSKSHVLKFTSADGTAHVLLAVEDAIRTSSVSFERDGIVIYKGLPYSVFIPDEADLAQIVGDVTTDSDALS